MKRLFHFDSPSGHYQADAVIVACFDARFGLAFGKFLKRIRVVAADVVKIAGGAKSLASPDNETDRDFVIGQLRKSVGHHGTRRVILMVHSDCGAYGGLVAFKNDAHAEAEHHGRELLRAAETVRAALPGIQVDTYFVDFEGVWEPNGEDAET